MRILDSMLPLDVPDRSTSSTHNPPQKRLPTSSLLWTYTVRDHIFANTSREIVFCDDSSFVLFRISFNGHALIVPSPTAQVEQEHRTFNSRADHVLGYLLRD
eukprot:GEMP01094660.1.p1 GENE.GEMP01094660.1~~GEMP01094660.1.p1  ORF type:complete len:102 (-),score=9.55 GEMP01094660.1:75-380(-)